MEIFLGFMACWIGTWIITMALYAKATRHWVMGPLEMQILGFFTMLCPVVGICEVIKARSLNKKGTYPNGIRSPWFIPEK